MIDYNTICQKVQQTALKAGRFIAHERENFSFESVEFKGVHNMVSYVDKQAEKMIVKDLSEILPGSKFITEEDTAVAYNDSAETTDKQYTWIIDPLDGTTNFIHNNAPYCVSIGLRDKTGMLLGVVYECTRDELFWAHRNSPAYLNDEEIHVSEIDDMDSAFIELGFPYDAERYRPIAVPLINRLYGRVGGLRLMGSAAAETCYLAAGRFEARIEAFLGPWDIGAGSIILQQAGGMTTDFSGGDGWMDGSQVLSSNGKLHSQLLTVIGECSKGILADK